MLFRLDVNQMEVLICALTGQMFLAPQMFECIGRGGALGVQTLNSATPSVPPTPHRMFDQIRIPIISEAGGKLMQDSNALLDLPQEQTTAVTTNRSAVELRPDLASL